MESDGFQIRTINDEKGKGLFATRPYEEGETILEEKPIVSCQFSWNADFGYLACDNCMRPLETAEENARRLTSNKDLILPYPECCKTQVELITECSECGVKYCSSECQTEAFLRYHKVLCVRSREKNVNHPLVDLKEAWKQMHYPPETATIMLLARMVAFVQQSDDKPNAMSIFSKFCQRTKNDTHEIALNFLREKFVKQIDVLREMMEVTLDNEFTRNWFTPDGFRSLLALVGTNGQGIGTSSFSCWVKNVSNLELPERERIQVDKLIDKIYDDMEEVVGSFLNNEGSGLYLTQSAVNHSCVPNAIVEFPWSNSTLILKALKKIKPGEEICTSYLDECELERSRHSRRKALSSLYLFLCQCDKCQSQELDDPDVTSEEEEYDDEMSSN